MFETYGDGLCQHSGDWPITNEYMADFLAGLATAMLTDEELANTVCYEIAQGPKVEDIEFAASVVFKPREAVAADSWASSYEAKDRYYSIAERKISSSPAKQHDKRYARVEQWNNGSPAAIYRMLLPEFAKDLERYAWAHDIRTWVLKQPANSPLYMPLPAEFLEWKMQRDGAQDLRRAFSACRAIVESYRLRASAECDLSNFRPAKVEEEVAA
jgi:hypothetical protein